MPHSEGPALLAIAAVVLMVVCLSVDCQCNHQSATPPPPPTRAPLTTEDVGRAAGKHAVKFGRGFVEGAKEAGR